MVLLMSKTSLGRVSCLFLVVDVATIVFNLFVVIVRSFDFFGRFPFFPLLFKQLLPISQIDDHLVGKSDEND